MAAMRRGQAQAHPSHFIFQSRLVHRPAQEHHPFHLVAGVHDAVQPHGKAAGQLASLTFNRHQHGVVRVSQRHGRLQQQHLHAGAGGHGHRPGDSCDVEFPPLARQREGDGAFIGRGIVNLKPMRRVAVMGDAAHRQRIHVHLQLGERHRGRPRACRGKGQQRHQHNRSRPACAPSPHAFCSDTSEGSSSPASSSSSINSSSTWSVSTRSNRA